MKFCPQCGTTFEPGARFCLECGFDKSTVETSADQPVATPQVLVDEPSAVTGLETETHEIKPGCPKCNTELTPDDRFCPECGFDTKTLVEAEPDRIETPVEINIPPVIAAENPVDKPANKQFCPQCGLEIVSGERFCQECGFDTQNSANAVAEGIANTPSYETNPVPAFIPPPVEPVSAPPKATIAVPSANPEPVKQHAHQQYTPTGTPSQNKKESSKKPWVMILLVVIGIAALGTGGWFAYNKFTASPAEEITTEPVTTVETPEAIITETPEAEAEITPVPTETTPQKPKITTKPKSKIDQELEKYREQEKNKAAQQNAASKTTKPDLGVKTSSSAGLNTIASKVIHEVGRKEDPKNKKPKNPVKFTLQKSTMIVRITTDHYNDGMGTSGAGSITIKDRDGNSLGTFKASGKTRKDGAPNAKWVAEPNKMFEKGTYYIWDSDFSTWSKNFVGNGFVVIEGYEVD